MKKHIKLLFVELIILSFILITFQSNANDQLPTSLKVTVTDDLGNIIEDAELILYKSKDDYLNSENAVMSVTSNRNGIAKFKKLDPTEYYIEVRKGEMSNDGKGAQVAPLEEGKINQINIVIE